MTQVLLHIEPDMREQIWGHLLHQSKKAEAAGFIFAKSELRGDVQVFEHMEWFPVPPEGFLELTDKHFALTDEIRAWIIKRAHDLGASIVEFHSHKGPWPATFSLTDQIGFQEFVPHVWLRLKGKPYLAVVVAPTDFDGLAWITNAVSPQYLDGIVSGDIVLRPTQLSSLTYEEAERHEQ